MGAGTRRRYGGWQQVVGMRVRWSRGPPPALKFLPRLHHQIVIQDNTFPASASATSFTPRHVPLTLRLRSIRFFIQTRSIFHKPTSTSSPNHEKINRNSCFFCRNLPVKRPQINVPFYNVLPKMFELN